jgi:hypothetical protein
VSPVTLAGLTYGTWELSVQVCGRRGHEQACEQRSYLLPLRSCISCVAAHAPMISGAANMRVKDITACTVCAVWNVLDQVHVVHQCLHASRDAHAGTRCGGQQADASAATGMEDLI